MGDRAYTRFSIPVHRLTPEFGQRLCSIFGFNPVRVDAVLRREPLPLEAGYDNELALRLVQGCPCLVIEDDDADFAGSAAESELQEAGISFLRLNEAGQDFGGSQTVFDGSQTTSIRLDVAGNVIVGVGVGLDRSLTVDEEEMEDIQRFLAQCGVLLGRSARK
jgi:hypothetical protein